MRCTACKGNIATGVEATKMVVEYIQDDGSTKIFGYMMSDGPLASAVGRLHRAFHHKCHWMRVKRETYGHSVADARARLALEQALAARAADPDYTDPPERDWRDQEVAEI
jgi:hypothetical protein